jgi:hypothetical protein
MGIDIEYAFRLPYRIEQTDQELIIQEAIALGTVDPAHPYFIRHEVRVADPSSLDGMFDDQMPSDFFYRLEPNVKWGWKDNRCAVILQPYMDMIDHLYKKLTRVKVFLQVPGMEINAHRELVSGNEYVAMRSDTDSSYGANSGVFKGHENVRVTANDRHRAQRYLTLKIPLTSLSGNHGRPYLVQDKKVYIESKDQFYCINEYQRAHGCDSVDFHRGIVFVDGIMDMAMMDQEQMEAFE